MGRMTKIELFKENFKFSSAHFTIFSDKERENIHGHNFTVKVIVFAEVNHFGMTFDYGLLKKKIVKKCKELNEKFLAPSKCPFLKVEKDENYTYLIFHNEKIPFLERDIKFLPIQNTTVEDLSDWFLSELESDEEVKGFGLKKMEVQVFSGPGQCGASFRGEV